jgi:hypothetical protein
LLSAAAILQEPAGRLPLALSLALEHPAVITDPAVLCAAARACKAWREAVQQCSVCNTAVVLSDGRRAPTLARLSSFVQWLPKHVLLVRSMCC